jgi:proline iminopeptidase
MSLEGEPVPVTGGYLWAFRSGSGVPVILCHGGPGLWDYTKPIADLITDVAEVIRFDQRGCGLSKCGPPYTLAGAVDDLDAVRRHFEAESPVLAGHSWGASLCLAYALRYPERVRGLIYLSGVGSDPTWGEKFVARRDELLTETQRGRLKELRSTMATSPASEQDKLLREFAEISWPNDFADPDFGRTQLSSILRDGSVLNTDALAIAEEAEHELEGVPLEGKLGTLRIPALVIHGLLDPRPYETSRRLAAALPNARFVGLEGVGHHAALEAPDRLRKEMREFILGLETWSPSV